jgi:RNA polymerase sigma factor (sigma-70 family)
LAAAPSIGRAASVERPVVRGADATGELYQRYSGQIFGYCLHQLGSREEAEDAVQTTFMNAFRGLQRGIVPEVESAWLFKIAHNVCLSRRRSTWRRGRVEAPNNLEVLQEVVPARERVADELLRLQDVLEEMPENQRRAILLREWQGLTYREIAEELELSQAAVETLIFRARRALAAGLEETPEAEQGRGLRKKARHGADAGAVLVALKALLSGGGAAKVAATAIVVATSAIAGSIGSHHPARHVRHEVPASTTSSLSALRSTQSTNTAAASSRKTFAAPTKHHSAPPARMKSTPPSKPAGDGSAGSSAPPPAATPSTAPPEPSSTQERPLASNDPPAASTPPAKNKPGKSGDSHGKGHKGEDSPAPAATQDPVPAPQADVHGNDSAPGQQDKDKGDRPDKGNGNAHK